MPNPIRVFRKDPNNTSTFQLDWGPWLHNDAANPRDPWESGDPTIDDSDWTVPSGITEESGASFTDTVTQIKLSGGTAGTAYDLVNRITTSDGNTQDGTIRVYVAEE